jgi:hypothetical protein
MFWKSLLSQRKGQRKEEEEEAAVSSKILSVTVTYQITWCHIPDSAMAKTNLMRFRSSCHDTETMRDLRGSYRSNDRNPIYFQV